LPNPIKYSTTSQSLAIRKGNYWVGNGIDPKGPTSSTDYWNGITPPAGGYTMYLNKTNNGPSIYVHTTAASLVNLTNRISGNTFTTIGQSLGWFNSQSDKMVFNIDFPAIPMDGITFISDIGTTLCYPLDGATSYSVDPINNGGTVNFSNGSSYVSEYGGGFNFDGTDDLAYTDVTSGGFGTHLTAAFTWVMIARSTNGNTWSANGGLGGCRYNDGSGFLMYSPSGTNSVDFYMGNTTVSYAVNIGVINSIGISTPHMYVISSNGSNLHKAYLDNKTPISNTTNITRAATQHEIIFGRDGYIGGSETKMNAYVQIYYNRQLSDAEVLQLYSAYQGRFGF
jgi:hypothetical protein